MDRAFSVIIILTVAYVAWKCTSQYLDGKDRFHASRYFCLAGLLLILEQVLIGESVFSISNSWVLLLCLSYLIIPVLYYRCNKHVHNMDNDVPYIVIDSRRDIMVPLYMLMFCSLFQFILGMYLSKPVYITVLILLNFLLQIFPVIYFIHFRLYGDVLSEPSIISIQQTRWQEGREYVFAILGVQGLVIVFCFLAVYICVYMWYFGKIYDTVVNNALNQSALTVGLMMVVTFIFYREFMKGTIISTWKKVKKQLEAEQLYTREHDKRYAGLEVDDHNALCRQLHGTVIIVIGESASRDYMQIYDDSFQYKNTPWLYSKRKDDDFIIFNNVYASYNMTMEVLKMAMTESSQYNNKKFSDSISIIDIAKKIGYRTYWFSHQGRLGQKNVATSMMAKTTDMYKGPMRNREIGYDKDLVELLKEVDPHENNFIVVHLMGSHAYYEARYPHGWAAWKGETVEDKYANTILYTDEVLKEIFDYARANLDLQCMLYFSDHGENLQLGHHPSIHTLDTLRIPMFIYLSNRYREKYAVRASILKENKNRFYSNDMLYNTIVGLLGVETDHYEAAEDLSSSRYNYEKDQILTFCGTMHITELE